MGMNQAGEGKRILYPRASTAPSVERVYQMAAGYADCNDANHIWIDPALRLALVEMRNMAPH
jgi:hypothetical protein